VIDIAELGWKLKRQEDLYLYFYVEWDREVDEGELPVNAAMAIWLKNQKKYKSLTAKLDDFCDDPRFADQPWSYWFDEAHLLVFSIGIETHEFSRFDEKLDELLGFVIPFLQSAEGIQKYFVP